MGKIDRNSEEKHKYLQMKVVQKVRNIPVASFCVSGFWLLLDGINKVLNVSVFFYNRRIARMMKSSGLWSMSVQGMALSQSSSSLRRWTWMERMPTPCLFILRKSFHSPAMTPWLSWLIQSASFGVLWGETTCPGTLRSSWWVLMESPTSATAEISSPLTLRGILKSF